MTYLLPARETVSSDDLAHLLTLANLGELFHHVLQRRKIQVQQLMQVLVVATDTQVRIFTDHSG